jgi:hypothetical protein
MSAFEIQGVWTGEFSYDPCPELSEQLVGQRFTLTATRGWFGAFRGTIQDDPRCGIPDPADFRGRGSGRSIRFVKRYPRLFVQSKGQAVSLRDYLQEEFGYLLNREVRPMPILYEGKYDEADESFIGTWRFGALHVRFWSSGQRMVLRFPALAGRWRMRRH